MSYTPILECRLCAATLPEHPVCDFGRTPLANVLPTEPGPQPTYPLALTQCPVCRHVQLTVQVHPTLLYPAAYPYESGTSAVFRRHLSDLARDVSGLLPPGSRVLEIGSNDGTLLAEFRALGHEVTGIDPAGNLAGAACLDGLPTYHCSWSLETARALKRMIERRGTRQPQCIVAANVMAHIQSPREFVAGVAELLPDDGLFVFENGYFPDIVATNAFPAVYHEHCDQYALKPLVQFFDRYGLSLYDAHRVESQGGSIRGYVRKGDHEWTPRLKQLLAEENVDLAEFNRNSWRVAQDIGEAARQCSGRFVVYGAPARLTTMNLLSDILLEAWFVVDDSPLKIGRYTADGSQRICAPDKIHDLKPDAVLIAAWTYEADIRARHAEYRGKWIIPLPSVKVV